MADKELYKEAVTLQMMADGSEEAFQLVFAHYRDHLYSAALAYCKSPETAEEVVQDVFLKVWASRETIPDIQSFKDWLFIVTRNKVLNALKQQAREHRRRSLYEGPVAEDNTDHKVRSANYKSLINEAVNALPKQQRQVYILAKEGQLSYEEIGQQLTISPLTVKTHMQRALQSVRQYLEKHGETWVLCIIFGKSIFP